MVKLRPRPGRAFHLRVEGVENVELSTDGVGSSEHDGFTRGVGSNRVDDRSHRQG